MNIAARWIGVGSIAVVVGGLGALIVGRDAPRAAPPAQTETERPPPFELGRCESGMSSFATNSQSPADFDRCMADHPRDVFATRHEGARTFVTAAYGSDLAICASHSACSLERGASDPVNPWTVWAYSGRDAWDAGSSAVMCAMVQYGGVRITSGAGQHVSIETEPGTGIEACFRQFAPAAHRLAR